MGRDTLVEPTWHKYWTSKFGYHDVWEKMSNVERWRYLNHSTICNMLGLARTSYLNLKDPEGKKKLCQQILLDIRRTRPETQ